MGEGKEDFDMNIFVWNGLGEFPLFPMVKIALGYEHFRL